MNIKTIAELQISKLIMEMEKKTQKKRLSITILITEYYLKKL